MSNDNMSHNEPKSKNSDSRESVTDIETSQLDSGSLDSSDDDIASDNILNFKWVLWYHDPNDTQWDINSYKKIASISSISDFWNIYNLIKNSIIENSMLFIMRYGILPQWEDPQNCNGGCWSFKIMKGNIKKYWTELSIFLLGETIINTNKCIINGLSISPKKSFCIVKIWNNDKNINNKSLLNKKMKIPFDSCIYKTHRD